MDNQQIPRGSNKYLLEVKKCTLFNALDDGVEKTLGKFFTSAVSIDVCTALMTKIYSRQS